jgi:hypothetical protein
MTRFLHLTVISGLLLLSACSPDPMMGDFDLPLIGGYSLVRESPDSVEVLHMRDSDHLGVSAKVVEIAWNERFILAKRQELKPRGRFQGDVLLVPVTGKFDFWIIDTVQTNRYGPLSEKEFGEKVQSLGQTGLKLKDISRAKKS